MSVRRFIQIMQSPRFYFGYWLSQMWCGLRGHGGVRSQQFWGDSDRPETHWFCKRCGKEVRL